MYSTFTSNIQFKMCVPQKSQSMPMYRVQRIKTEDWKESQCSQNNKRQNSETEQTADKIRESHFSLFEARWSRQGPFCLQEPYWLHLLGEGQLSTTQSTFSCNCSSKILNKCSFRKSKTCTQHLRCKLNSKERNT
jgi:hypothetical protein